jgi:hypothetical protein
VGVEIVKAAIFYGGRLPGNAYKVLVAMSMTALDKPSQGRPASLYWGGWDALALVLGYPDAGRDSAGHGAVKQAIKSLRDGGHISPMVDAGRGTRQSYMVHPGGLPKGEQNPPSIGEEKSPPKGEEKSPHRGRKTLPPRKETGEAGLTQDIELTVGAQPQTEGDSSKPHKPKCLPGGECDACGKHYGNRSAHPLRLLLGGA